MTFYGFTSRNVGGFLVENLRSKKCGYPNIVANKFDSLEVDIACYGFLPSHQRPNKVKRPIYPKNF